MGGKWCCDQGIALLLRSACRDDRGESEKPELALTRVAVEVCD